MSYSTTTPVRRAGNDRVLTFDWSLLFRRLSARGRQAFSSVRYKAAQTEYIPPTWMQRFRLTWFRIGLMGIAIFVFTQKQVDFTISMGKEGVAVGANDAAVSQSGAAAGGEFGGKAKMGLLPLSSTAQVAGATSHQAWSIDDLNRTAVEAYINRFQKVAQGEERKFSIPAAANMALAILHSNAGQSTAATKKNNHFFPVTQNTYYENAWLNWRSHSQLIEDRFPQLASESVNYQQWIAALAKTNYSPDRDLANKVMEVVERYHLDRL